MIFSFFFFFSFQSTFHTTSSSCSCSSSFFCSLFFFVQCAVCASLFLFVRNCSTLIPSRLVPCNLSLPLFYPPTYTVPAPPPPYFFLSLLLLLSCFQAQAHCSVLPVSPRTNLKPFLPPQYPPLFFFPSSLFLPFAFYTVTLLRSSRTLFFSSVTAFSISRPPDWIAIIICLLDFLLPLQDKEERSLTFYFILLRHDETFASDCYRKRQSIA